MVALQDVAVSDLCGWFTLSSSSETFCFPVSQRKPAWRHAKHMHVVVHFGNLLPRYHTDTHTHTLSLSSPRYLLAVMECIMSSAAHTEHTFSPGLPSNLTTAVSSLLVSQDLLSEKLYACSTHCGTKLPSCFLVCLCFAQSGPI